MNNKPEIIRALEHQKLDSFFSNQLWKLIGSVTLPFLVYFVLSLFSFLIVKGFNKKMLATWLATILGIFVSFALCYVDNDCSGICSVGIVYWRVCFLS